MYNWSTDIATLKRSREKYQIWKLEQLINFGLDNKKISTIKLKKYWDKLSLDPKRKSVLEFWMR